MRRKILLLILFCLSTTLLKAQLSRRVLFLGNSYTYVNNLPQLVADIADNMGDTLIFDSHTPGGYTLDQHAADNISRNKIMAGGWDYLVMQDQSQIPSFEEYFSYGAKNLCQLMRQYTPCARAMFYMTWGRENGDASNCAVWPPVCTYLGMDSLLHMRYMETALYNKAEVSPVGAVWKYIRQNSPGIGLYQSDGSHPSLAGSYLAACCFYTAVFKKDPTLITFNSTIDTGDARAIRQAAKIIVFDSLPSWDFVQTNTVASFDYRIGTGHNEVIFTNNSINADSYFWDFGDTTTSTLKNPVHNYSYDGTYTITLTDTNCDLTGTYQSIFQQTVSFCPFNLSVFPDNLIVCPASGDTLWTQSYDSYQWLDMNGDTIPGDTNQYMLPSGSSFYSVLVTQNNCVELSPPVYVEFFSVIGSYYVLAAGNMIFPDTACSGDTLQLILTPNRPPFPIDRDIEWFKNGFLIPFSQNDTLLITSSGNYGAVLHNDICPDYNLYENSQLNYTFLNCVTGIEDDNSIHVYPNPSGELMNVIIDPSLIGASYLLIDLLGRILQKGILDNESNVLNIRDFSGGVYILDVEKISRHAVRILKR